MSPQSHLFWGFTKEFSLRVEAPVCLGEMTQEEATARDALLVKGEAGSIEEGNCLSFSWLIDKRGVVLDALFHAFGDPILIGCAEIICEKSIGKRYERALSIKSEQLEVEISQDAIPKKLKRLIALSLEARDRVCEKIQAPSHGEEEGVIHPKWETLSQEERLLLIREAVEEYIAPHLKRDGGGIEVLDLIEGNKVQVRFQGACVECFASSGSTFFYIQHVLRTRVHNSLVVYLASCPEATGTILPDGV